MPLFTHWFNAENVLEGGRVAIAKLMVTAAFQQATDLLSTRRPATKRAARAVAAGGAIDGGWSCSSAREHAMSSRVWREHHAGGTAHRVDASFVSNSRLSAPGSPRRHARDAMWVHMVLYTEAASPPPRRRTAV